MLLSPLGSTNLAPGASTTFTLRLESTVAGVLGGPISLGNNDRNENPFDLSLNGSVVEVPAVIISGIFMDGWAAPASGGTKE
jgi:hypothetical protein